MAAGSSETCHRDLFADNVLRTPSGSLLRHRLGERRPGRPEPGARSRAVEFGCGDPDRARALYDAYVDADGPGRIDRPGHFSMAIAQLGHIGEIACRGWLDPTRAADRQHNADWASEFLTEPITRRIVDELVEAVRG